MPNAHATVTSCTQQHHIRDVNRAFAFDNPPLLHLLGGAGMPFDHMNALDPQASVLWIYLEHFTLLTPVATGYNPDKVILFDVATDVRYHFTPCHT
jgi:hypothetical protein